MALLPASNPRPVTHPQSHPPSPRPHLQRHPPPHRAPTPQPLAAPSVPSAPTPPTPRQNEDASLASIIDTIEAIIIALILALTFRAFVVEAFVIPTSSMAPTLLGAHFNVICPVCGYAFDRNASLNCQVIEGCPQKNHRRSRRIDLQPQHPLRWRRTRRSYLPQLPAHHPL